MTKYPGYGINLEKAAFRENYAELLLHRIQKEVPELLQSYTEYKADRQSDFEEDTPETERFEDFIRNYDSQIALGNYGLEGLITDLINLKEPNTVTPFDYEDCILHVPATIPENKASKDNMRTQEQIAVILSNYVNPLLKEPLAVQWYTITCA